VRRLLTLAQAHPGWLSFAFLTLLMVPFVLFEARNAPMEFGQRIGLALATGAVAAFCGWIISRAVPPGDSM
jgi:hypothetical protein